MGLLHAVAADVLATSDALEHLVEFLRASPSLALVVSPLRGMDELLVEQIDRAVEGRQEEERLRLACLHPLGAVSLVDDPRSNEVFGILQDTLRAITLLGEIDDARRFQARTHAARFAVRAVVAHLLSRDLPARGVELDAREFATTSPAELSKICREIQAAGELPVLMAGAGWNPRDPFHRFDRDASDVTGVLLARALDARRLELWKAMEVPETADRNVVSGVRRVDRLTLAEAETLAALGESWVHLHACGQIPGGLKVSLHGWPNEFRLEVNDDAGSSGMERPPLLRWREGAWMRTVESPAPPLEDGSEPFLSFTTATKRWSFWLPGVLPVAEAERVDLLWVLSDERNSHAVEGSSLASSEALSTTVRHVLRPGILAGWLLVIEPGRGREALRALNQVLSDSGSPSALPRSRRKSS